MGKINAVSYIEEAIEDIRQGRMVILCDNDSDNDDNEGFLCMAAEKVTPEAINFMAKFGRGLICLSLTSKRVRELNLTPMTQVKTSHFGGAFTVSIDAREGTTTGISAYDRAITILTAIDPDTKPEDLIRPGHVFPIIAMDGGVLKSAGHTEGSIDLARLAGLYPAGVICGIMNEDGEMAKFPDLIDFAKRFELKVVTIAELIKYRLKTERLVRRVLETKLTTEFGDFKLMVYENEVDELTHLALVKGEVREDPVLVRMHSSCVVGDVFQSRGCDCGFKLRLSMKMIREEGCGVIVYLSQEERGINFCDNLKIYQLQEKGEVFKFKPNLRNYGIGAQILLDLGIRKIKLLTNNPRKIVGLGGYGLEIVERIPLEASLTKENIFYIKGLQIKDGKY